MFRYHLKYTIYRIALSNHESQVPNRIKTLAAAMMGNVCGLFFHLLSSFNSTIWIGFQCNHIEWNVQHSSDLMNTRYISLDLVSLLIHIEIMPVKVNRKTFWPFVWFLRPWNFIISMFDERMARMIIPEIVFVVKWNRIDDGQWTMGAIAVKWLLQC